MIKNILKLFLLMFSMFYFNSCDILRSSLFEVSSWEPGDGWHPEPEKITVSLNFSRAPDRASVERHFSLTGGSRVRGTFLWEGEKMTFTPLLPLEKNTDYTINISAEAHDSGGLSMDTAFERSFTTRPSNERPFLLSCYPSMYAELDDERTQVRLGFSMPVALKTLYDNVSFTPSMTGVWRLEDDDASAIFTPSEPWTRNSRYEMRFSTSLTNNNGMNIGNDFLTVFTIGTDRENPRLLHARRITKGGDILPLDRDTRGYTGAAELPAENSEWEKEDRLSLVFSKPVDGLTVKNCLSAEEASSLVMETPPGYETEFIFRFDSAPVYESRFVFRLKAGVKDNAGNESRDEYIYRIFADGKFSKPPALAGIRMPMAPGSDTDPQLCCFGIDSLFEIVPIADGAENYPSGESVKTWIELYFITAQGASIDQFSLMELFRVDTSNNVLSFSPRQIKTENFSAEEPQEDWENFQRIEISGYLVNSPNFGVVNFQIASGLKDSLGNKNEKAIGISLVK